MLGFLRLIWYANDTNDTSGHVNSGSFSRLGIRHFPACRIDRTRCVPCRYKLSFASSLRQLPFDSFRAQIPDRSLLQAIVILNWISDYFGANVLFEGRL